MNIFEGYKIISSHSFDLNGTTVTRDLDSRKEFSEVYHITHFPAAKELIESGRIITQLIKDKSKLNGQDIKVVWLSPNDWYNGSLYGNVRFSYDFNDLIEDKKFYSVEVMDQYEPTACRILITNKNYIRNPLLSPYDPRAEYAGPWYIDQTGQNYYHKSYNIEFMFDSEFNINDALKIDFVNHHPDFCNINRTTLCPDIDVKGELIKTLLTCYLISNDIKLGNLSLNKDAAEGDPIQITHVLNYVLSRINKKQSFKEDKTFSKDSKIQLCKSILKLISEKEYDAAVNLSEKLNSYEDLENIMRELFAKYFEVDSSELYL